jgi:propionyl-CoA synthetase
MKSTCWMKAATRCRAGQLGAICVKLPLPPSCLPTLWNADDAASAPATQPVPRLLQDGDAGFIDADGYLYIMARTDDIINVAGHRLSTGGMEEILASHPDVAECAVLGIADELKGQLPLGFVVLKAGVQDPPARSWKRNCVKLVRDRSAPWRRSRR